MQNTTIFSRFIHFCELYIAWYYRRTLRKYQFAHDGISRGVYILPSGLSAQEQLIIHPLGWSLCLTEGVCLVGILRSRRKSSLRCFQIILRRLSPSSHISFIPRGRKVKHKASFAGSLSVCFEVKVLTMYWTNCSTLAVVKMVLLHFCYILNTWEYPELFSLCPHHMILNW